jgi:hypothetical protein
MFCINDHELSSRGGDGAIEYLLGSGEAGGIGAYIAGIINEITTNGDASLFVSLFLCFHIANNRGISDGTPGWDARARNEIDGVSAFVLVTNTLGKLAEFVGHGMGPDDVCWGF